jgi:hypothetical protein
VVVVVEVDVDGREMEESNKTKRTTGTSTHKFGPNVYDYAGIYIRRHKTSPGYT